MYDVWANQKIAPDALENKPDIPSHLSEYVRAFTLLSTRRQSGMDTVNPISMADILAYAKSFRVEDLEKFVMYISAMDCEFIRYKRTHKGTN